jgi:hypothetical protein
MTAEQQELLARRERDFNQFLSEMRPALEQLGRLVSPEDPDLPLRDPVAMLPALERLLANEDLTAIPEDDRRWLSVELMHFVAQFLISEHGGEWRLERDPASPAFARYVITGFTRNAPAVASVEPGAIAHAILSSPPPRSVIAAIDAAEGRLSARPKPSSPSA